MAARDSLAAHVARTARDNERLQALVESSKRGSGISVFGGVANSPNELSTSRASRRREPSVVIDDSHIGDHAGTHSAVSHVSFN